MYSIRFFIQTLLELELTNKKNKKKKIIFIFVFEIIMKILTAARTQLTFDRDFTVPATRQCVVMHYRHTHLLFLESANW